MRITPSVVGSIDDNARHRRQSITAPVAAFAGSHTEPGGYASESDAEPQFSISDTRSPAEVATALRAAGYDPVWKDWQRA